MLGCQPIPPKDPAADQPPPPPPPPPDPQKLSHPIGVLYSNRPPPSSGQIPAGKPSVLWLGVTYTCL